MEVQLTWYVTFISIVFGVFISVWVQPFSSEMVKDASPPNTVSKALLLIRGYMMFLILMCLWWWYAIYLGRVFPANGFFMYVFEFSTLAAFAMAFRYWNENYVFPSAVLIGSGLMLVRFIIIYESGVLQETDADQSKKDLAALTIAIITLGLYVFVIIGALAVAFMGGMEPQKRLSTVHYVTTFLLLVGVVATLLAVDKAEGLKWGTPPCWLDQQTDCVSKFRVGFCTVISSELAAGTCELPWSTQETG